MPRVRWAADGVVYRWAMYRREITTCQCFSSQPKRKRSSANILTTSLTRTIKQNWKEIETKKWQKLTVIRSLKRTYIYVCFNTTLHYTIKWIKCSSSGMSIDVVVFKCRKICPTENRWKGALFAWPKKQQNFGSPSNCRYCADRAQNMPGSASNIWLIPGTVSDFIHIGSRGGSAVGSWTCDLHVAGSISSRWLSRNIGQLSLASLRGR